MYTWVYTSGCNGILLGNNIPLVGRCENAHATLTIWHKCFGSLDFMFLRLLHLYQSCVNIIVKLDNRCTARAYKINAAGLIEKNIEYISGILCLCFFGSEGLDETDNQIRIRKIKLALNWSYLSNIKSDLICITSYLGYIWPDLSWKGLVSDWSVT